MSTVLTIDSLQAQLRGSFRKPDALAPLEISLNIARVLALTDGDAAGQANQIYIARRTLAADTDEDLDLAGELPNPFGEVITFAKVRAMAFILHPSPAAGPLLIGGHDSAAFKGWIVGSAGDGGEEPKVRLRNGPGGGLFLLTGLDADAYPVTATTADILTVENEHATLTATYDVVIIGAKAA